MKIPPRILSCVAGPLLASAALSCSSPPPVHRISPIAPVQHTQLSSLEDPDRVPVPYDMHAEAERTARADTLIASNQLTREARIDTQDAAARRRAAASQEIFTFGGSSFTIIGCGRG
jgi:hypothetical protein